MPAHHWQIGDCIQNRWEVHKIFKGGMGIVYVVYDAAFQQVYAAKTFREEVLLRSPDVAECFNQEALTWVHLDSHQNVARAHFVKRIAGKPYLFLEYVSGGDLSRWIGTPRLREDLPQVLRFAIQFCAGMIHAMAKGITAHRDIKPQNCLVARDEILKITDFGLARAAHTRDPDVRTIGTPEYMAPEQWDREAEIDARTDIYSFGAMLYEMLIATPPFGKRPGVSIQEMERRHRCEPPPVLVSYSPALCAMVEKCLLKKAELRFRSFEAVREELANVYQDLTGRPAPLPAEGRLLTVDELVVKGISLGTLGRHEEEITCYDAAIELNPGEADAWANKGTALRDLGRPDAALACLDRALELNPTLSNAWSNKSLTLSDKAQDEESFACIKRALELSPRYARGWYNKGILLADRGRWQDALECFERATALDPHYETAWVNRGVMLRRLSRYKESLTSYDEALGLDVRDLKAWTGKADTLSRTGRYAEALICCDKALDLDPRDAKVWCKRGSVLNHLHRTAEALTSLNRAIELDPRDEKSWHNKGVIMMFSDGSTAVALECFQRCVAIKPDLVEPWLNMGTLYFRQKEFTEAARCFDHVLTINDEIGEAWFNKGASLMEASGASDHVLACFEAAHRLGIEKGGAAAAACHKLMQEQKR